MKHISKFTALLIAATFIAGPALSESFKRIRKEADYRAMVVDRTITAGSGNFTAHSDGTITGQIPSGALSGKWQWNQKFFCRTVAVAGKTAGTGCTVIKVSKDGKTLMVIGDKGKGEVKTYTIH